MNHKPDAEAVPDRPDVLARPSCKPWLVLAKPRAESVPRGRIPYNMNMKGLGMAQYKYGEFLHQRDHEAYDTIHYPSATAPNLGIYRCVGCGDEIGIAKGHTLPPQNHHQHSTTQGKIQWKLLVFAQSQA